MSFWDWLWLTLVVSCNVVRTQDMGDMGTDDAGGGGEDMSDVLDPSLIDLAADGGMAGRFQKLT